MAALTTVAAIAALGTAGASVVKSLSHKKPAVPQLPPAPVPLDMNLQAAKAASIAQTRASALAGGQGTHGGTLLTGPSGVLSPAPTAPKTLLGY